MGSWEGVGALELAWEGVGAGLGDGPLGGAAGDVFGGAAAAGAGGVTLTVVVLGTEGGGCEGGADVGFGAA